MIINKWAILRADLDPVIGSEQGKSRPVLVISDSKKQNEVIEALCFQLGINRKSG